MPFFQGLFGPPNIQALAAKRDVDGLIKALAWGEDGERATVCAPGSGRGVGGESDNPAVEPVIGALQDEKRCRQARGRARTNRRGQRCGSADGGVQV